MLFIDIFIDFLPKIHKKSSYDTACICSKKYSEEENPIDCPFDCWILDNIKNDSEVNEDNRYCKDDEYIEGKIQNQDCLYLNIFKTFFCIIEC